MDVDETRWPLVVQTFDGYQNDEDVAHFERRMVDVLGRGESFVLMCIIRRYAMNLGHVDRLAAFTRKNRGALEAFCRGNAIVIPSPSFRFILSSFNLMVLTRHPTIVCEDVARAEPWLVHRLKEAGLPVPHSFHTSGTASRRG
jgi:hypothetical protein